MTSVGSAKAAFDELCRRGEVVGPVNDADIDVAEKELSVVFPDEYREFLSEYGAAVLPGAEVYGLPDPTTNTPPLWSHVTVVTKSLRDSDQAGANDRLFVPISEDGTGVFFYLNTRASPETEVWAIGPGVSKAVASNLYEFLVDLCDGRSFAE